MTTTLRCYVDGVPRFLKLDRRTNHDLSDKHSQDVYLRGDGTLATVATHALPGVAGELFTIEWNTPQDKPARVVPSNGQWSTGRHLTWKHDRHHKFHKNHAWRREPALGGGHTFLYYNTADTDTPLYLGVSDEGQPVLSRDPVAWFTAEEEPVAAAPALSVAEVDDATALRAQVAALTRELDEYKDALLRLALLVGTR